MTNQKTAMTMARRDIAAALRLLQRAKIRLDNTAELVSPPDLDEATEAAAAALDVMLEEAAIAALDATQE